MQFTEQNFVKKPLVFVVLFIGLGIFMLYRSGKEADSFDSVTGKITSIGQAGNDTKSRYISIEGYPKTFDIFIGKDPGDFSPKFEMLDSLKEGDLIKVYHDDLPMQRKSVLDKGLDKGVQFIKKGDTFYYERGNKDKYLGYFLIGGAIVVFILMVLKQLSVARDLKRFNNS